MRESIERDIVMIDTAGSVIGQVNGLSVFQLGRTRFGQPTRITGSINPRGQVQAIGGVNEKIEGFFDLCAARGLTGSQDVVIPASNRQHLMLREDVVQAAAEATAQ